MTESEQESQLSINTEDSFKPDIKICQKDECKEPCILRGKFCEKHRTKGKTTCNYKDCKTRPNYNFEGKKHSLYCVKHKKDEMILVSNKSCKQEGCNTRPMFNFENEVQGIYCNEHKEGGMINVKSRTCKEEKCSKQPIFNYEGQTIGIYCSEHALYGMIDVKHKKCKSEWCDTVFSNKKYEGYCAYCFFNLYPDSPLVRNYKTKEKSVVDFIRETFKEYEWINDKTIDGGCSKKRPDLMLDFGSHILIIEIDEDAHSDYDCSCENKRLMEISQDLGHRPIVFIRFNPDSYTDKNGKKIKSCWSINKVSGLLYINNKKQWKERLEYLKEQVEYWIEYETEKTIEIIQLFYNENSY